MTDSLNFDYTTYLSPFTWRYGSQEMRTIWSETQRRRLLRRVWVALARAQAVAGLVTAEQIADLAAHQDDVDIARATEIEHAVRHDLMAEIKTFAEQCPVGGAIIHLGATSQDILDNADVLRLRQALELILGRLRDLLLGFCRHILDTADVPAIAFTHLQPAEPTTVGYRLAVYAQDLLADWHELRRVCAGLKGKGFKGAVGTAASYTQLLEDSPLSAAEMERLALQDLGLEAWPVATQTYPRKQDWWLLNALAGLAGSLYKFAFDLRLLQSPPVGEWSEPFGAQQVGSSAMPFKRNPIAAENITSLARYVASLPRVGWDNAAHSLLERTLDDSANRRIVLAEACLAVDELLVRAMALVEGLQFWSGPMARNLQTYGVFAATERVLMAAVKAGGDRQALHEMMRRHSLAAWDAIQRGESNPLAAQLSQEPALIALIPSARIAELLDASNYVGDAPERARALARQIEVELDENV